MDQAQFQQAQSLYQAGEYRQAAKLFLASAGRGSEGNGSAYHMAGNSLMRLRRYNDAISVYRHALHDETYGKRGAVEVNLAQSLVALGEYADAVTAFGAALNEPDYTTPYKALQGMAGALLEMGRVQDAAGAYRRAALDDANPDPGKALNNLGLCFMALGRPADAAEAYKAALGFDTYEGRGKALSNLGQAFVAQERWDDAVKAFNRATELHGFLLGPAAAADYERALKHATPAPPAPIDPPARTFEKVEGWQTGEIVPPPLTQPTEEFQALQGSTGEWPAMLTGGWPAQQTGGWSNEDLQNMEGVNEALASEQPRGSAAEQPEPQFDPGTADVGAQAAATLGIGDEQAVDAFFSMTDAEMKERDKQQRRSERAEKRKPGLIILVIVLAVVLVVGAAVGAWYLGLGYPSQNQTANGLMTAHQNGTSVDTFWVAVPQADVAKEMGKIPPTTAYTVDAIQRGPQSSSVVVTVTPQKGAPLRYKLAMVREGVGWKVTGVENDWSSVGGQ